MVEAEIAFATEINHILHPMEQLVKEVIHKIVYDSTYEFSIFSESNEELRVSVQFAIAPYFLPITNSKVDA